MFLPDIKNMISILYAEDRKKSIFKTLIITRDIDKDRSSAEMNKRSDQDRCRQTAKVIMSGFLHQKTFVSIPFTIHISPFLKNDSYFLSFYVLSIVLKYHCLFANACPYSLKNLLFIDQPQARWLALFSCLCGFIGQLILHVHGFYVVCIRTVNMSQ